jgi:hypothetical protein
VVGEEAGEIQNLKIVVPDDWGRWCGKRIRIGFYGFSFAGHEARQGALRENAKFDFLGKSPL